MKKGFVIGILFMFVVLVGCRETVIESHNITVIEEVFRECPLQPIPDCVCNFPQAPDCICENQKIIEKEVVATGCSKRLSFCSVQADYYRDELADCLITNNSISIENVTEYLTVCMKDLRKTNDTLMSIVNITK